MAITRLPSPGRMKDMLKLENKRFNRALRKINLSTNIAVPDLLKMTMMELLRLIIPRTPIDTGRARAGWASAAEYCGVQIGYSDARNYDSGAITGGKGEGEINHGKIGKVYYIEAVNGVPYILMLEFGHSKQAPAGMVRISMRQIRRKFYEAVGKLPSK